MTELRQALRSLLRSPGYTATGAGLLALGVGATTVVYAMVSAVLLRPLPYAEPENLVAAFNVERAGSETRNPTAPANYIDWRDRSTSFEYMAAAAFWSPTLTGDAEPERIEGIRSTPELFELLGTPALIGRTFTADELTAGDAAVVVIGYGIWQRRFGGDPGVVGSSVILDGNAYTVAGVMPERFRFPPFWATRAEIWAPFDMSPDDWANRGASYLRVFGRLRPNVPIEVARSELSAIGNQLAVEYPETNEGLGVNVELLREPAVAGSRATLMVLLGAVGILLLIACANLTNMLLGRALARDRETAIRIALGAGAGRLIRQWTFETVLLGIAGAGLGLLVAAWSLRAVLLLAPESVPPFAAIVIDGRIAAFAFIVSIAAGALTGLVPALRSVGGDIFNALRGRRSDSAGGTRLRRGVVTAEIALATVLLTAAGLLLNSFIRLSTVDPGFDTADVVTATVSFNTQEYAGIEAQQQLFTRITEQLEATPGVLDVGLINHLPISGDLWRTRYALEADYSAAVAAQLPSTSFRVASEGFFTTLGIRLLAGRLFDERDRTASAGVVIVNETLVAGLFGDRDPVGRRIRFGTVSEPVEIVGVVADVRQEGMARPALSEIYLPYAQNPVAWYGFTTIVLRGPDTGALATAVRSAVRAADPGLPVFDVATMADVVSSDIRGQRTNVLITGLFAGSALLLSLVGLYAVITQITRQRSHEMAVRLALGAGPERLLAMVARQGMLVAGAGVSIGLLTAAGLARSLSALLWGVSPWDPLTFAAAALTIGLTSALASVAPAIRASRTSALTALRGD